MNSSIRTKIGTAGWRLIPRRVREDISRQRMERAVLEMADRVAHADRTRRAERAMARFRSGAPLSVVLAEYDGTWDAHVAGALAVTR